TEHRSRSVYSALAGVAGFLAAAALSTPERPAWALPDHTTYDVVLGQVRAGARRANGTDDRGLSGPTALVIDRGHTPNAVYVADLNNGRVLGWKDVALLKSGAPADLFIGQPDKNGMERFRKDQKAVSNPGGLAVDKDG